MLRAWIGLVMLYSQCGGCEPTYGHPKKLRWEQCGRQQYLEHIVEEVVDNIVEVEGLTMTTRNV